MWGVLGTFSPKIARANGSGAYESAIGVQGGNCRGIALRTGCR